MFRIIFLAAAALVTINAFAHDRLAAFQGMTDYEFLAHCYLSKKRACRAADLNDDEKIDAADYRLLRNISVFDVDHDGIVATSADQTTLQSCYGIAVNVDGNCASSDFNNDGIVDTLDLNLYESTVHNLAKYDLNHNGIVDYTLYKDGAEIEAMRACLGKPVTNDICAVLDVNHNGSIDVYDYSVLRLTLKADLNQNSLVEFSANGADYHAVEACIGHEARDICLAADLNTDGIIDLADLSIISSFGQYDINGDLILDFSTSGAPFLAVTSKEISEREPVSFYIYFSNTKEPVISFDRFTRVPYGLGNLTSGSENFGIDFQNHLPAGAKLREVIYGDLTGDGEVDEEDVRAIKDILKEDNAKQKLQADLNNDGTVDQSDADIIDKRIAAGTRNNAYYFEWQNTTNGEGLYLLDIAATDWENRANNNFRSSLKVYERNPPRNYYGHDDVLVVVNRNSTVSMQIGEYYIRQRNIPMSHVAYIDAPVTETITPQQFRDSIQVPVEAFLHDNNIVYDINYIVTTKGVPLRYYGISSATGTAIMRSVDSLLTMIAGAYAPYIEATTATGYFYGINNPYWMETARNTPFTKKQYDIYLVTRLTGYTFEDVKHMIDNAANPAATGDFVLDVDPSKDNSPSYKYGNDQLRSAAALLQTKGESVILDQTTTFLTEQTNVLGYFSWGSNDAYSMNNAKPNNIWLPGAIADTFVSTSARTFNYPASYGQSLIADLIAEGITGVMGYAFEPGLGGISKADILFDKYTSGFVLADSFYGAYVALNHTGVVVGDPKTAIRKTYPQYDRADPYRSPHTGSSRRDLPHERRQSAENRHRTR